MSLRGAKRRGVQEARGGRQEAGTPHQCHCEERKRRGNLMQNHLQKQLFDHRLTIA